MSISVSEHKQAIMHSLETAIVTQSTIFYNVFQTLNVVNKLYVNAYQCFTMCFKQNTS